nr:alpha/beta hydrolase [uncultured Dyadobacter sp.]
MPKLILCVALFLISLLTIFPAPAYPFWLLAIMIDEFPWLPVAITVVLLLLNIRSSTYPFACMILLAGALILFCTPVIRAGMMKRTLTHGLSEAFGPALRPVRLLSTSPFDIVRLFNNVKPFPYQRKIYCNDSVKPLSLDFYPSVYKGPKPCVIVVHGGSWKSGDNTQLPELNSILAMQGYHVAAINYRLAPQAQSPAPVEDVKQAIRFLRTQSEAWQIDTSRFVLLGRSAGAQIALLAAYTLHDPSIKGVIDFYGPADMVWGYSIPSNPLIMDSRKVMEDYLGGPYDRFVKQYEDSSPIRFVTPLSPPTLLIHGKNDVLVDYEHSRRLNQKLAGHHVRHYLLTLPWATHGFDYSINGPGGQLSTYAVSYFLNTVTR